MILSSRFTSFLSWENWVVLLSALCGKNYLAHWNTIDFLLQQFYLFIPVLCFYHTGQVRYRFASFNHAITLIMVIHVERSFFNLTNFTCWHHQSMTVRTIEILEKECTAENNSHFLADKTWDYDYDS